MIECSSRMLCALPRTSDDSICQIQFESFKESLAAWQQLRSRNLCRTYLAAHAQRGRSCKVSKQTEILDTFFAHTSPVVTRRVLIRAIRRGAREAYERATGLQEDKPDMDSAGIGRDRKWRRLRARSDASRSTNRLLLADQGKEWCKLEMAGVSPVIELSRLVFRGAAEG